jgi:hypothetical protein
LQLARPLQLELELWEPTTCAALWQPPDVQVGMEPQVRPP